MPPSETATLLSKFISRYNPGDLRLIHHDDLKFLVFVALMAEEITYSKARELLGISLEDLEQVRDQLTKAHPELVVRLAPLRSTAGFADVLLPADETELEVTLEVGD